MSSEALRKRIERDAAELRRLQHRVHITYLDRDVSWAAHQAWSDAAHEFRERYDLLAFPGGEVTMKRRLQSREPLTLECAICFLEVRPYFFRSGYMFKDLMRWCRKVSFSPEQQKRYEIVSAAYSEWRERKRSEKRL